MSRPANCDALVPTRFDHGLQLQIEVILHPHPLAITLLSSVNCRATAPDSSGSRRACIATAACSRQTDRTGPHRCCRRRAATTWHCPADRRKWATHRLRCVKDSASLRPSINRLGSGRPIGLIGLRLADGFFLVMLSIRLRLISSCSPFASIVLLWRLALAVNKARIFRARGC